MWTLPTPPLSPIMQAYMNRLSAREQTRYYRADQERRDRMLLDYQRDCDFQHEKSLLNAQEEVEYFFGAYPGFYRNALGYEIRVEANGQRLGPMPIGPMANGVWVAEPRRTAWDVAPEYRYYRGTWQPAAPPAPHPIGAAQWTPMAPQFVPGGPQQQLHMAVAARPQQHNVAATSSQQPYAPLGTFEEQSYSSSVAAPQQQLPTPALSPEDENLYRELSMYLQE